MPETAVALPPLSEVIERHGIRARRALGQNFLLDLNLTRRIARAAGGLDHADIIEIGPGPGGLTRALLIEGARRVVAIERDRRCIAALAELAAAFPGRLTIVEADALACDPAALATPPRKIVANLPYNIATKLLVGWLHRIGDYERLTVMLQKEVAQRLAAKPRSKDYGRLSVLAQWLCAVSCAFDVNPQAFVPPPKVTSTVVNLTPLPAPRAPADIADLERVTAAAFGQRRKMLRASLKGLGGDPGPLLTAAGIEPSARAEDLTVEQFCALAEAMRWRAGD